MSKTREPKTYPPGFFVELMKRHNWPPGFVPQPPEIRQCAATLLAQRDPESAAVKARRAEGREC